MLDIKIFIGLVTVIFIILSVVWSNKDWINAILRLVFILMSIYGILVSLILSGYVIK